MEEIKNTAKIVKEVLTDYPETRNSDMALYLEVCRKVNPEALTLPFWSVVSALKLYKLPNFETVRRTRQKIQASCPELSGNEEVTAGRAAMEEVFREYARERNECIG